VRRHLAWALLAWLTFIATVIYAAEPRYYLMVMPILLMAWLMLLIAIARRLPPRWGEVVLGLGLLIVVANNLSRSINFVREQRSTPFLEHYKSGNGCRHIAWRCSSAIAFPKAPRCSAPAAA
jgi:hypothetical protein